MDDFPHLVGGTVTEDNVHALKDIIDKVKDNVIDKSDSSNSEKPSNDTDSKGQDLKNPESSQSFNQPISKIFDSLKKKSESATSAYKEDFNEILSTVKSDANSTFDSLSKGFVNLSSTFSPKQSTSESTETPRSNNIFSFSMFSNPEKLESTANKISSGISSFFKNSISIEPPEDIKEQEKKTMFNRKLAKIITLQNTASTYIDQPEDIEGGSKESFEQFVDTLDEETLPQKSFQLLEENSEMKKIFLRLVPNILPQTTFWHRYYYRVHLLEKEEEEKKKLVQDALGNEEELFSWDDGDSDEESEGEKNKQGQLSIAKLEADPASSEGPSKSVSPSLEKNQDDSKPEESYEVVDSKSSEKTGTEESQASGVESKSDKDDEDWGQWE